MESEREEEKIDAGGVVGGEEDDGVLFGAARVER